MLISRIASSGTILWAKKIESDYWRILGLTEFNNQLFMSYSNTDIIPKSYLMKMDLDGNFIKNISIDNDQQLYTQNKFLKMSNNTFVFLRSLYSQFQVQCFDADLNLLWCKVSIAPDLDSDKNPATNVCLDNSGNIFTYVKLIL